MFWPWVWWAMGGAAGVVVVTQYPVSIRDHSGPRYAVTDGSAARYAVRDTSGPRYEVTT